MVSEDFFGKAAEDCNCNEPDAKTCQLMFTIRENETSTITCTEKTSTLCRQSVGAWARAYRNAENADHPECRKGDPNFKASQDAYFSCIPMQTRSAIPPHVTPDPYSLRIYTSPRSRGKGF